MQAVERKRVLSAVLCLLLLPMTLPVSAYAADSGDDTPPVVHSVAVDQSSVYPGGSITVSADAEDFDSGVQSIKVQFQHEASGDTLTASLLLNSDEDIDLPFSGVLRIPNDTPTGAYRVVSVTARDWESNQARYTWNGREPLTSAMQASFTVSNAAGSPPRPLRCHAQTTGSGISILFAAAPGGVNIDQVTLLFENDANHHKLSFVLEQEDERDGAYAGLFAISPDEPSGAFTLKKITIKDVAGVKTTYTTRDDDDKQPLTITAAFVTQAVHNDLEAPVLHAVSIGRPVWDDDEAKALLTVRASDNLSGIEHITLKFVHVGTGDQVSKVLRAADSSDGMIFTGYLKLDKDAARGSYRLESVTAVDRSGNRSTYCHPDEVNDRKLPLPQIPTFQFA